MKYYERIIFCMRIIFEDLVPAVWRVSKHKYLVWYISGCDQEDIMNKFNEAYKNAQIKVEQEYPDSKL